MTTWTAHSRRAGRGAHPCRRPPKVRGRGYLGAGGRTAGRQSCRLSVGAPEPMGAIRARRRPHGMGRPGGRSAVVAAGAPAGDGTAGRPLRIQKAVRHARRGCCSRYGAERAPLPPGPACAPGGPARSPAAAAARTPALRPAAAPGRSDRGALARRPSSCTGDRGRLGALRLSGPSADPLLARAPRRPAGGPWEPAGKRPAVPGARMPPLPLAPRPAGLDPRDRRAPPRPAAAGRWPPRPSRPASQPAGSMRAEARRGPPTAPSPSPSCPAAPRRPFPPRTALSSARR